MKKLFFSAVALVAFSSVSMANTVILENSSTELDETILVKSCMQVYMETYDEFVRLGLEHDAANEAASAYGECISSNTTKSIR